MRRAQDLMGLPVIDRTTGRRLGVVKDVLLSEGKQAAAIVLETRSWLSSLRYIDWERVESFGDDAVTVPDANAIRSGEDGRIGEPIALRCGKRKMQGLPLMTVQGDQLGTVEDVYFDEKMDKRVIGFELSEGFWADVTEGRKWLPAPDDTVYGEHAIVVPASCKHETIDITIEE